MTTSTLAIAIERKNWELAALCLLLGFAEVAAKLPPETLDQLLDLLDMEPSLSFVSDGGANENETKRSSR